MMYRQFYLVALAALSSGCFAVAPAWCQTGITVKVESVDSSKPSQPSMTVIKDMTGADLKAAIRSAAESGDLQVADARELIDKITDVETLMAQFDFIQEQERRMISSVGSSFH